MRANLIRGLCWALFVFILTMSLPAIIASGITLADTGKLIGKDADGLALLALAIAISTVPLNLLRD